LITKAKGVEPPKHHNPLPTTMNRSEIDLAARIDNLQNAINHQQAEINILRARLRDSKEERYRLRTAKSKIDQ
jgi:hypothetical protein